MDKYDKKLVTQGNALVSATYTMSLHEKRLLVLSISRLDPTSSAWKQGRAEVTITASEWASTYGTSSGSSYSELRAASRGLFDRSVRIYGDHANGKNIRWLSAEEYSENEGRVTLTFSGPVLYHLTGMIEQFTSYDLLGVSGLKSIHAVRIYELASQFKSTGWRNIDVLSLRAMLGLKNEYPKFNDFRKRVLDRGCNEVTEKSDLEVSWEPVKTGRVITAVILRCKEKRQLEMFNRGAP